MVVVQGKGGWAKNKNKNDLVYSIKNGLSHEHITDRTAYKMSQERGIRQASQKPYPLLCRAPLNG